MSFRKILFWLHLASGCVAGAIVLVMSFTGVLLTYQRQLTAWSAGGQFRSDPPQNAQPLKAGELVEAIRGQRGDVGEASTLTLRSDPREPAEVRIGREGFLYFNVYTGKMLDGNSAATRAFFQKVVGWHRWLGVEGAGRSAARAITGACNLAFLVLLMTGAYLWLPRQWTWRSLRPITWFRSSQSGKARDFNWHNVFGIWALVPLFLIVLTALPMSYQWANNLLYRMTGSEPPPPGAGRPEAGRAGRRRPVSPQTAASADLNTLWTRAANQVPGWKSITAPLSIRAGEPLTFTIDTGDGGQPQKRSTLALDASTAAVVRYETFSDGNPGRKLRTWSRFAHTGEYYGVVGQTIAGLASTAGVMLVWTGISLALRRFAAWKARRRKRSVSQEEQLIA
ncbi:MAG: PepSY-associated TM helix domain-containing protein [Bryobacteraceae bacterium]